jgi:glycosyltransferase involved in cell wall biosynthesis
MIFLDAKDFFVEAIESVLAQTYQDFELIFVDDGSTDGSTEIAKAYAQRLPHKVRYLDHEGHRNLGMSTSRNHGVRAGRGGLVSFLDADDVWLSERLERYVAAIEAFPQAGMVYGPTLYWYTWAVDHPLGDGTPEHDDFPGQLAQPTNVLIQAPAALRKFLDSDGGSLPGMGSLIIRREAFEAIGGFEAEFRGLYEDQVFLSKMTATHPVVVIPEVLDHYRQHSASCCYRAMETGDYDPVDLHPARGTYLAWLERYCRETGVRDRALLRSIRRQIWPYRSAVGRFAHYLRRTLPIQVVEALRRHLPPRVRWWLRKAKWRYYAIVIWLRKRRATHGHGPA